MKEIKAGRGLYKSLFLMVNKRRWPQMQNVLQLRPVREIKPERFKKNEPFSGGSRYVSGIRNGAMSYVKNNVTAFDAAAKGAVSPGVHIVIFSCDAFLLRISFR